MSSNSLATDAVFQLQPLSPCTEAYFFSELGGSKYRVRELLPDLRPRFSNKSSYFIIAAKKNGNYWMFRS